MGRRKGSKNKKTLKKIQPELFDDSHAVALTQKEHEDVHEPDEGKRLKIIKDLREKERVEDPTMMDSTDLYIDEEDNGRIRLDGKATDSYVCYKPTLICKACDIKNKCKKENKRIDK